MIALGAVAAGLLLIFAPSWVVGLFLVLVGLLAMARK